VDTTTTRNPDGTFDIVQRGSASWQPSAEQLERLYWVAMRRATLGVVALSQDAICVFGLWPALLRFGPLLDGGRPIVGGIFAREPYGAIRWSATQTEIVVAVERFAPLLRGPFWRFESWFHDRVGRRFLVVASGPGN
jgi:hypothetical protein